MPELKCELLAGKRWWFHAAWIALFVLLRLRIVRDFEKAGAWLARNGMWFGIRDWTGKTTYIQP